MHDTPPPPPPQERDTVTLLEDLCVALRDVGVYDYELPAGARVLKAVEDVRAIHHELEHRGADPTERLAELSEQTRWQMAALLQDCLGYPQVTPYVREQDGVRRHLRCYLCRQAERPADARTFWFCDGCLRRILVAIDRREPIDGVVLFRTYNEGCRCEHADAETVLASESWSDTIFGNCRRCFEDELARRANGAGADGEPPAAAAPRGG
jgi:hypothetical protein